MRSCVAYKTHDAMSKVKVIGQNMVITSQVVVVFHTTGGNVHFDDKV